jgi:pimeloyl-ACP methyl ester carboxylesterase
MPSWLHGDALTAAVMHVFYLHGFASSARSTKAGYFAGKLRASGITLHTPDFNEPDFSTLTVTRMVEHVTGAISALPEGPVVLIGSSLGGFVAVQTALSAAQLKPAPTGGSPTAARSGPTAGHPIERLVLLAPALDFSGNRTRDLGDRGLEEWQATGQLNVFHHAFGRVMPVHYELYSDACGYDCVNATLTMPIQIFQGRHDTAVDPRSVEAWAHARPNVELHLLDDDHQLGASLDQIWGEMKRFLALR